MADSRCGGNFLLGECFADIRCRHGHEVQLLNIGRDHFVACDCCRTYMHVGSNLMSSWRQEDTSVWRRNSHSVEGYGLVECAGDHGNPDRFGCIWDGWMRCSVLSCEVLS